MRLRKKRREGKKNDAQETFVVPPTQVDVPATALRLGSHIKVVWDDPEGEGKNL